MKDNVEGSPILYTIRHQRKKLLYASPGIKHNSTLFNPTNSMKNTTNTNKGTKI